MKPPATAVLLILCAAGGQPAGAQIRASIESGIGGADLQRGEGKFAALSSGLSWSGSWFRVNAEGTYANVGSMGYGTSGRATVSAFTPIAGSFLAEAYGTGTGVTGLGRGSAAAWLAGARLHLRNAERGAWLSGALGAERSNATRRVEAGFWKQWGSLAVQLQGGQTSVETVGFRTSVSGDTLNPRVDSIQTSSHESRTDLSAWVRWGTGPLQLGVGAGQYLASARTTRLYWESEAALALTSRIAIVGAAGDRPTDLTIGMTGGRYMILSLRASLVGTSTASRPAAAPPNRAGLQSRRLDQTLVELRLPGRGAETVEVMGDFTDWQPVPLEQIGGGWWRIVLSATPGVHYLNVRMDGSDWQVPPGVTAVPDDYYGKVGVIRIP
jgi:hypothetical protein